MDIIKKIEEIKSAGHKVRVTHSRLYKFVKKQTDGTETEITELVPCSALRELKAKGEYNPKNLCTNGGQTQVDITFADGLKTTGTAICHENDNFNKKTGLIKSFFRAMAPRLKEVKQDFKNPKTIQ